MHEYFMLVTILTIACSLLTIRGNDKCDTYDDAGLCVDTCPQGKVGYNPACDEDTKSLRTCRKPIAHSIGVHCDYSRCDCEEPSVWDEAAKKCVLLENCSDQSSVNDDDKDLPYKNIQ